MAPRRGALSVFLAVTFTVSWAFWLPLVIQAQTSGLPQVPWTFFLASAGPAAGAVSAAVWEGGVEGLRRWAQRTFSLRFAPVWWLVGIGLPVAYFLIGYVAAAITSGAWPDPDQFGITSKLPGLSWPLVAMVWVVTFGVGEEAGWRGWLQPALTRRMPAFWSSMIVAGTWIAWHAPAFLFNPTYTAMGAGAVGWMLALISGSFLLAWMALGAGWSIVPVLAWHAGFDLLTASDQSAGTIASAVSVMVMCHGVWCALLLWRRRPRTLTR